MICLNLGWLYPLTICEVSITWHDILFNDDDFTDFIGFFDKLFDVYLYIGRGGNCVLTLLEFIKLFVFF